MLACGVALVAACQAGPAAQRAEPVEQGFAPSTLGATRFSATYTAHTVVDDRTDEVERPVEIALRLDHEVDGLRLLLLDDPIGGVVLEVRPDGLGVFDHGEAVRLLGPASAESTPIDVSTDDAGPGCVAITATREWAEAGALDATWREDAWRFCTADGLVARSRTARFPAGERHVSWTR